MLKITYSKKDYRYIFILHDNATKTVRKHGRSLSMSEISLLEEHLNQIPAYQFLPSFSGIPRPEVYLEKTKINGRVVHYCSSGLWKEIRDWCKVNNIEVSGPDDDLKLTSFSMSLVEFKEYVQSWGLNLEPRDYQVEAAWRILHYRCSLSQLATRAGKTLIAYMVFRYMLEHGAHNILMIVPSISLVRQGVEDMKEYQEFFQSETVWAKGEYAQSANLTIGTFQSLVKRCNRGSRGRANKQYDPVFFNKFDVVCVDECHKANCQSIKDILSLDFIKHAKLRFGFSGTLPDESTLDSYAVQALLGPCVQDLSSRELINQGYLAEPIITQVRIHYKDDDHMTSEYIRYGEYLCSNFVEEDGKRVKRSKDAQDMTMIYEKRLPIALVEARKQMCGLDYRDFLIDLCKAQGSNLLTLEQMIAEHSQKKLDTIREIIFSWDKNGILFAHNEAYIDHLYDYLSRVFPNRNIYKIKGSTSPKSRTKIMELMNTQDTNAVLVASYGCVGTGLTFKNVDYCVFAQSFKSRIINMQSIGRGLLLGGDKQEFYVYDLIDCLPTKRLERQGDAKRKVYAKAQYKFKIISK